MKAHKAGAYLKCRNGAIAGMCTSGDYNTCSDPENDSKYVHKVYCNTDIQVYKDRAHCKIVVQEEFNEMARCPKSMVMVGRAASGGSKSSYYGGKWVAGWTKCCEAISQPAFSFD